MSRVSNPWVRIGRPRPDARASRDILVNGEAVGWIQSRMASRRPHQRNAGWEVYGSGMGAAALYVAHTLAEAILWAQGYDGWPVACWVYMSGDRGYMPDNSGCCVGRSAAVEGLVEQFELGDGRRARELRRYGWVQLSSRVHGAEYAEVSRCECGECATGCTVATADTWGCRLCDG